MSAGKVVRDRTELEPGDLAAMFQAADEGIQSRGKAKLGDKTIVDALHPASEAFSAAVAAGGSLQRSRRGGHRAATAGRDSVTPLRSKIGRASWVGERTEGKVDPGCAMFVLVLEACRLRCSATDVAAPAAKTSASSVEPSACADRNQRRAMTRYVHT